MNAQQRKVPYGSSNAVAVESLSQRNLHCPLIEGLGDPTPTKENTCVHAPNYLVGQQNPANRIGNLVSRS